MRSSGIIACVFDFDETLGPDSTSRLLESAGVDTHKFWTEDVKALIDAGYDPALAWLRLLVELCGEGRPLGLLNNHGLSEFGRETLDASLFPGVLELLADLRKDVSGYADTSIEFYIVSGGLRDLILGSEAISREFTGVYASELAEDSDGVLKFVKRCVTFTEKTRYLFEINKGIRPADSLKNPFLVNKAVEASDRRIPFTNLIYVGDGLTDIPCFSLVNRFGGMSFGVFDPTEQSRAKRALNDLLKPGRVVSMHSARYGPKDDLGAMLRAAVNNVCVRIQLEREEPYSSRN